MPKRSKVPAQNTSEHTTALVPALVAAVPPSGAPADVAPSTSTSLTVSAPPRRKSVFKMPKDSLVRKKVLAIIALKTAGYSHEQIAKEMGVTRATISTYLWRANRAAQDGWLKDEKTGRSLLDDPTERIEYELTNKVVDNLAAMLNSEQILERGQKSVKMEATFEMAKGVLFEKFKKSPEGVSNAINALKIEIVMPSTGGNTARADSMGGEPIRYVDADIVK